MSGVPISSTNKYPISVMSGREPNHLEEDVVNKDVFNNMCTRRVFQGRQVFLKEFPCETNVKNKSEFEKGSS